jgi:hypothetical protein
MERDIFDPLDYENKKVLILSYKELVDAVNNSKVVNLKPKSI